jgi:hypothetical protein
MSEALDRGKTPTPTQHALSELSKSARAAMTARERAFFDEPYEDFVSKSLEIKHAKETGRLYKILNGT